MPQHRTPPALLSAHVFVPLVEMPRTSVRTSALGVLTAAVLLPSPTSPETLSPQQRTPPAVVRAQTSPRPASMALTPANASVVGGRVVSPIGGALPSAPSTA